ncbi:TetR/AcrR family transcriptional regulator [Actinomadura barringtoniae]|uniref:TetR/AcrR family transcriptional regulator n=1 Tax=Actinomadura barringtoniae TaxID=1427535 RepID=A0A939PK58_9ACTN|nr:TetR/AcrR family transcriptional regulator [Actinomadura barringtoniae]MBO2450664.1 TetR/AcrR family transcriptional regulator [Actinomadura barringtoniae]
MLAAAKEAFAEQGVDVPIDEIARRAGVGNATLYRHFPTRRDLIVAVYADEVAALNGQGAALLGSDDPGGALYEWLLAFITHVAAKRDLALAVPDDEDEGDERTALFARWHESMHMTAGPLLARARHAGAVRTDVTVAELLALANGIALAGTDPERLLTLVREGLR